MNDHAKKTNRKGSLARADRKENPSTYARRPMSDPHPSSAPTGIPSELGQAVRLHPAFTGDTTGRVVMSPTDNDAWHLFWKWSRGEWEGHYVYWYLPRGVAVSEGLRELSDRYEQVLAGDRRPIRDRPRPTD